MLYTHQRDKAVIYFPDCVAIDDNTAVRNSLLNYPHLLLLVIFRIVIKTISNPFLNSRNIGFFICTGEIVDKVTIK
ncbi:MAG: hypothetical protein HRT88_18835 [Lentisphaeraceae bacterium]|nr:hypothetical protein [Lentisphaeraceae bacterium]